MERIRQGNLISGFLNTALRKKSEKWSDFQAGGKLPHCFQYGTERDSHRIEMGLGRPCWEIGPKSL